MLLQYNLPAEWQLVSSIIVQILVFILGVVVMRWYADKKDWKDEWGPAIIVNLLWLIINLVIGFVFPSDLIWSIVGFLLNIILGIIVVMQVYDKGFGASLFFALVVLIIEFILIFIITFIIVFILVAILVALAII